MQTAAVDRLQTGGRPLMGILQIMNDARLERLLLRMPLAENYF